MISVFFQPAENIFLSLPHASALPKAFTRTQQTVSKSCQSVSALIGFGVGFHCANK